MALPGELPNGMFHVKLLDGRELTFGDEEEFLRWSIDEDWARVRAGMRDKVSATKLPQHFSFLFFLGEREEAIRTRVLALELDGRLLTAL